MKEHYIDETEGLNQKILATSIGVSFRTINRICNTTQRGFVHEQYFFEHIA